jgi:hypothetical protein
MSINKNHCQTVINTFQLTGKKKKKLNIYRLRSKNLYETEALVTYGKT